MKYYFKKINKMYKSKSTILKNTKQTLIKSLNVFLKKNQFIRCKILKRNVNLSKLPEILINRKNATFRLRRFLVAVDIIKKSNQITIKKLKKWNEYELIWLDRNWEEVFIHIKDEFKNKDKELFFISCF